MAKELGEKRLGCNRFEYAKLFDCIEQNSRQQMPEEVNQAVEHFKKKFQTSLLGVLFYGSCLREQDCSSVLDFHLLVDQYWSKGQSWWEAGLNCLLPPNVYNMNLNLGQRVISGKYAVYPLKTFSRAVSEKCIHPYFWARFAQPTVVAYAKDDSTRIRIVRGLVQALHTFVDQTAPIVQHPFSVRDFWITGLSASYSTELRSESFPTISKIYDANKNHLQKVTPLALYLSKYNIYPVASNSCYQADICSKQKTRATVSWKIRRTMGKSLAVIRLAKSSLTFNNSLDYIVFKLEKHSGKKIEVNPFCRKHPVLGALFLAIKLYRKKVFR